MRRLCRSGPSGDPPTGPLPPIPIPRVEETCLPSPSTSPFKARTIDELVWNYKPSEIEIRLDNGMAMLRARNQKLFEDIQASEPGNIGSSGPRSALPFGYIFADGHEWHPHM